MSNIIQVNVNLLSKNYKIACPEDKSHQLTEAALILEKKIQETKQATIYSTQEQLLVMVALQTILSQQMLLENLETEKNDWLNKMKNNEKTDSLAISNKINTLISLLEKENDTRINNIDE